MKNTIHSKLLQVTFGVMFPLLIGIFLILFIFFLAAKSHLNDMTESEAKNFLLKYKNKKDLLLMSSQIIKEDNKIIDGILHNTISSVNSTLRKTAEHFKIPFAAVYSKEGYLLGTLKNESEILRNDKTTYCVSYGLSKREAISNKMFVIDGREVLLTIKPIFSNIDREQFLGIVCAGYFLDNDFLYSLKVNDNCDLIILRNSNIIASTIEIENNINSVRKHLNKYVKKKNKKIKSIKINNDYFSLKDIEIDAKEIDNNINDNLFFIVLINYTKQRNVFILTGFIVFILLVGSILLALILQNIIADKIEKPIRELVDVSQAIMQDNYERRAVITGSEEFVKFAYSYNKMLDKILNLNKNISGLKKYLDSIIESMPSAIITIDENGEIIQCNKNAYEYSYYTGEIKNQIIWEICDNLKDYKEEVNKILTTKKNIEFKGVEWIKKNELTNEETVMYVDIIFFPLINQEIKGVVIRIDDVTELKLKEQQLRHAQKMETLGTLVAGIAHDFNNILGAIMGTISVIKYEIDDKGEISQDKLKERILLLDVTANKAKAIIKQLLNLSKDEKIAIKPVNLTKIIKENLKICNSTFDKSIKINSLISVEEAIVEGNYSQIEQIIMNLLINSSHALTIMRKDTDKQGGTLRIKLEIFKSDRYFKMVHPDSKNDNYYLLSISDTGVGINKKDLEKIFDPFYTTKKEDVGTGLGLAMVYSFIKKHNGVIEVISELGVGTTFNLYFPVYKKLINDEYTHEEELKKGSGTIMFVDDEPAMRRVGESILKHCNYNVILAADGRKAIDIFRKEYNKIDLVILDMVMPNLSGKETFYEMKNIDPNLKVILVSGFVKDDIIKELIEQGAKDFVGKPYTIYKLSEAISKVLNET